MKIHVFNARVSLVSSTRFAGKENIKEILGLTDIPESVNPLLRQSVMPEKFLSKLELAKSQIRATMLEMATRDDFFGWIIDPAKKPELLQKMADMKTAFYKEKAIVIANAPKAYQEHLDMLKEKCIKEGFINCDSYIAAVEKSQPSVEYLEEHLQFNYLNPRTIELHDDEIEIIRQGVLGQALYEISQRADKAADLGYVTSKLRAADEIIAKLNGLSYVEPKLEVIAMQMTSILAQIPRGIKNEDYDTMHALAITGMLQVLSDDQRVQQALSSSHPIFNAKTIETAVDLLTPTASPAPIAEVIPTVTMENIKATEIVSDMKDDSDMPTLDVDHMPVVPDIISVAAMPLQVVERMPKAAVGFGDW